jgi:ABC-type transporter Mla subunit MlaD
MTTVNGIGSPYKDSDIVVIQFRFYGRFPVKKLENIISQMAEIQKETCSSFENMHGISEASAENLLTLQNSTQAIFQNFEVYLDKLGNMSDALTSNMSSVAAINEYMKENAQAQTDTIKTLSEYEKELTQVSGLYTSTMQTVIADIKDQFASTMISLKAVTSDMTKSGEYLRSAYQEFSSSTVMNVEQIFKQFDENLTAISSHLAENISDLQDAVDELPAILKSIQIPRGA